MMCGVFYIRYLPYHTDKKFAHDFLQKLHECRTFKLKVTTYFERIKVNIHVYIEFVFIKALSFSEHVWEGLPVWGTPNSNKNSYSIFCILPKSQLFVLLKLHSSDFAIILLIN